jgi:uncharacterized protein YbcC (UPF0753/DUF2309 family)
MAKWLAAFMDEGLAEWEMPNKTKGFITLGANWLYMILICPKRLLAKSQKQKWRH